MYRHLCIDKAAIAALRSLAVEVARERHHIGLWASLHPLHLMHVVAQHTSVVGPYNKMALRLISRDFTFYHLPVVQIHRFIFFIALSASANGHSHKGKH